MANIPVGNTSADITDRWLAHTILQPADPGDDFKLMFADNGVWNLTASNGTVDFVLTRTVAGVDWIDANDLVTGDFVKTDGTEPLTAPWATGDALLFPNGTALLPSMSYAIEPTLGWFRGGAGNQDFTGVLRPAVDVAQNIGTNVRRVNRLFIGPSGIDVGNNPSGAGALRMDNGTSAMIGWRNSANDGDAGTIRFDSGNRFTIRAVSADVFRFSPTTMFPEGDGAYSLGISTNRFNNGWFSATLFTPNLDSNLNVDLRFLRNNSPLMRLKATALAPDSITLDLGEVAAPWNDLYVKGVGFFGLAPHSDTGTIRVGANSTIIGVRNAADTGDFSALRTDGSDRLFVGGPGMNQLRLSGQVLPEFGSTNDLGSATIPWRDINLSRNAVIAGTAAIGAVPADAGDLRMGQLFTMRARNNAGTQNLNILSTDANDAIILGDNGSDLIVQGATITFPEQPSSTVTDFFAVGVNPATAGELRFASGATIRGRINAGGQNATLLEWNTSDQLVLGNNANVTRISIGSANGPTAQVRIRAAGSTHVIDVGPDTLGLFGVSPTARSTGWSNTGATPTKVLAGGGTATLANTNNVVAALMDELISKGFVAA